MVSVSIINGHITKNQGRNIFNNINLIKNTNVKAGTITNPVIISQINTLNTVHQNYSLLLSEKKYEQIPSNYVTFLKLLNSLKSINVLYDSVLSLLIRIAENALTGSMNVNTIYTSYAYNEIKIALLNKRIEEILSNKNVIHTISSTSSTIVATKTMKLSPVYSYYVYLYGCPAYGVGFDPSRLAFVQSLPFFKNKNENDLDT